MRTSLESFSAVVFDFDGTLVQSLDIKYKGLIEVTRPFGNIKAKIDEVLKRKVGDRTDIFRVLVDELTLSPRGSSVRDFAESLVNQYTRYCEDEIAVAPEIPGALNVLKFLQEKRIPACLNSATPEGPLKSVVEKRGWGPYFSLVLGRPRSKEENLDLIESRLSVPKNKMMFVGDSEQDRVAAVWAGCTYVGLENQFSAYTTQVANKITTLSELMSFLFARG